MKLLRIKNQTDTQKIEILKKHVKKSYKNKILFFYDFDAWLNKIKKKVIKKYSFDLCINEDNGFFIYETNIIIGSHFLTVDGVADRLKIIIAQEINENKKVEDLETYIYFKR